MLENHAFVIKTLGCQRIIVNLFLEFNFPTTTRGRLTTNEPRLSPRWTQTAAVFCRYQVQSTRTFVTDLIIDNVSLDDSGVYTCRTSSRQVVDTTKVTVVRCKWFAVS